MQNTEQNQENEPKRNDPRFLEQLELAREGDESAVSCLWLEFGYDFQTGHFAEDGGAA